MPAKNRLIPKVFLASIGILLMSVFLYSSGDVFRLDVDPTVANTLPGRQVVVNLVRPEETLDLDLTVSLENLAPEVASVPSSVLIPAGMRRIEVALRGLQPGTANIRASAALFGDLTFSVNVLADEADINKQVRPETIDLDLQQGQSATVGVSIDIPPDTVPSTVDLAFAVDDRPTFEPTAVTLARAAPSIIARLRSAFPSLNLAFAVTKFQDYGGPGTVFLRINPPPPEAVSQRPFVLLLPLTPADTPENIAAIVNALGTTLPGGVELSTFSTYLEALGQIAQGAGLDGNANGSRLDSGPAAVPGGGEQRGFLNPGPSGDVPPFSSKPAAVPSAGNLGGVGFRAGSQRIVLLATNTSPVAPVDRAVPFPATITGAGGVQLPSFVFQEVPTFTPPSSFQNPRFGPVSASVSVPDPSTAVAPLGALTVPEVFSLLTGQNIQVVSFFQVNQAAPNGGLIDPRPTLSAVARLTGAIDSNRNPLVFELIGANAEGFADQIIQAIRPLVTGPRRVSLRAVGNDAGFGFTFTPANVLVGPGGVANFDVTITGTGARGSFEIQFVTEDNVVLGRIPVNINGPGGQPPSIVSLNPTSGPIGTQVTITGTNFSTTSSANQVTFGNLPAQILSTSATSLVAVVPAGSVAGPVDVVVTVDGVRSNALPFTVLHTITGFSPTTGVAGTQFTITGSGFSPSVTGNTVTFGTTTAVIVDATNTQIRGLAPNLTANAFPVRVTTNGVTTDVGTFNLLPAVTSITPPQAAGNATITLAGTGFSPTPGDNVITFTDNLTGATATAAATSASLTQLTTTVPAQLVAGAHSVTVTVNGRTSAPIAFAVTPFITSATPAEVRIGGEIRISGTGFSPVLSENVVTLNGRTVALAPGSTAGTLIVIAFPGLTGASLDIVVTTRGVASNTVRIAISPAPVIIGQTIGGVVFESATAVFTRRDLITVTVSGADPNGDVASLVLILRDGEGQVLGFFDAIDVRSILTNQSQFVFSVPIENANHFTAAHTATLQLKDAAGNASDLVTIDVVNPDIRPTASLFVPADAASIAAGSRQTQGGASL
jgi:hypothetical protein